MPHSINTNLFDSSYNYEYLSIGGVIYTRH